MFSFKLIHFVIFILNLYGINCQISDKRLCVDEHCKEPVSLAKTLHRYSSPDPLRLSFAPNVNVTIYSKAAGKETSLWGAEINGKRGYIPKNMVREYKILNKATILVDTELHSKVPQKVIKESPQPDKVQQPFEVVDGTTFYNGAGIEPSSTESPVLSTAEPSINKEEKSAEHINAAEDPKNSVVGNVFESMANWLGDDKDDGNISDDENGSEQDEEDNDEDDNEEEEEVDDDDDDEKESSLTKNNNKFKIRSLETNDPIEIANDVTQINEQETNKVSENNHDNKDKQGNDLPSDIEIKSPVDEVSDNTELNGDIKDPISEKIEVTTVSPLEQEIPLPIEQETEEVTTLSPVIVEETLNNLLLNNADNISLDISNVENQQINVPENSVLTDIKIEESEQQINTTNIDSEKNNTQEIIAEITSQNTEVASNEPTDNSEDAKENIKDELPNQNEDSVGKIEDQNENYVEKIQNGNEDYTKKIQEQNEDYVEKIQDQSEDITNENQSTETELNNEALPSPPSQFIFGQILKPSSEESDKSDINPVHDTNSLNSEESNEINIDQNANESDVLLNPNIIEHTDSIPEEINENSEKVNKIEEEPNAQINLNSEESESAGIISKVLSFFSSDKKDLPVEEDNSEWSSFHEKNVNSNEGFCSADNIDCKPTETTNILDEINIQFNSDFFLYLITTAISCTIFLFVYLMVDKSKRVSPLIARINKLEKDLLVTLKENELLREQSESLTPIIEVDTNTVPNEIVEELKRQLLDVQFMKENLESQLFELHKELEDKQALELQVESLEKELETSTEVGLELNRIISEMLDPENGSERLKENVEQLQRQLLEQKDTINNINSTLREKEMENSDLIAEVEMSKKKSFDLQNKLDEMVGRILQVEKERDEQQKALQNEISIYQRKYNELAAKDDALNKEIQVVRSQLSDTQRQLDLKIKEYQNLKENIGNINSLQNNNEALRSIFDTVSMKAEYDQLKNENERYSVELQQAQLDRDGYEKNCQRVLEDMEILKHKYEEADKEKVEANMKLEVLNNYFKKREAELQEEVLKFKSIWDAKEGEATSTTERIRLLKEEIENYKSQNENLKQEIISQEIDLKSQISVLEKKVHENWLQSRQTERRLEDARQEAAQLRNRLTLRERAIDERAQNRLQSPLEQNGDLSTFSPHPIDSPASPPLLYSRDHMTKSPPVPGLPFIPPPPGAPFLPPPPLPGLPPFVPMPPPPLFPGDRRPPPLGRMSSPPPPLNSRYSPDASAFSPYDRNSPSPPYDSEYGASPPPLRGYSPYRDDRRDYKRLPPPPHIRSNGRNAKGPMLSSGSDRSNESLDKINRNQSKLV